MANKVADGYQCPICEEIYPNPAKADACRDSHEILYVPMTRTELNRLINAIFLENLTLIPESLLETFRKIQRKSVADGVQKKMS